jgi:hypothetical protein
VKVLVIEPMFTPLKQEDIDAVLPCLLKAIGVPPSCLILDRAGSNLGVHLKCWADRMELPVELVAMSPFVNDIEASLVGHLRGVEKADAVIAFWKTESSLISVAVLAACARKGIPLIAFYAW